MGILLPSVLIVAVTLLMILAMRTRARRRVHYKEIAFSYEGQSWLIILSHARCGVILHTYANARAESISSFCPQIAYTVRKNGDVVIDVPNFWAQTTGWCMVGKNDEVVMDAEIVFKDLLMARAFVRRLLEVGFYSTDVIVKHNKIVVRVEIIQNSTKS